MSQKQVLDWSNYTGVPTSSEIATLKGDGWDAVILGTQNTDITRRQYAACQTNGFPVEALYLFVYWWDKAADLARIDAALGLSAEMMVPVWLDCEWVTTNNHLIGWVDTPQPAPATIVALMHEYVTRLGNKIAGIYTGRWWWQPYAADTHDFCGLPLWYADYKHAAVELASFEPFGGWTKAHIWQWSSGGVRGLTTDLNEEEETPVTTPPVSAPIEHYPGELNQRRALTTMIYNLETTTGIRFSDDGSEAIMTDVGTGAEIGRCKILNQPTWAAPN